MTWSRDEVKAWVRSNAGVLLSSGRGFGKAVYQEILAALRPLTPSPPLNTVLILPDGDEEFMRWMFERFDEVAKAGGILRVPVLFPGVSVVIQDATSDNKEPQPGRGIWAVSLCAATVCWLGAGETVKRRRLAAGRPAPAQAQGTELAKILVDLTESDTQAADIRICVLVLGMCLISHIISYYHI